MIRYQVIYQTDASNLITETARTASSVTFARVGIARDMGDEYFAQSEANWATISANLVAHYLKTGIFQRIN